MKKMTLIFIFVLAMAGFALAQIRRFAVDRRPRRTP